MPEGWDHTHLNQETQTVSITGNTVFVVSELCGTWQLLGTEQVLSHLTGVRVQLQTGAGCKFLCTALMALKPQWGPSSFSMAVVASRAFPARWWRPTSHEAGTVPPSSTSFCLPSAPLSLNLTHFYSPQTLGEDYLGTSFKQLASPHTHPKLNCRWFLLQPFLCPTLLYRA